MTRNKLLGVWRSMHSRCYNQKQACYRHYGARGIAVDPRWHGAEGFKHFEKSMGPSPVGGTLERINNDGSYSPENCRWATRTEQAHNKRNNRNITANGQTKTMAEWARDLGCSPAAILYRIKNGMSEQDAVTLPIPKRPNSRLSEEDVRLIRSSYPVKTLQMLADEIGVSKKTVMNVVHNKIFKDVA